MKKACKSRPFEGGEYLERVAYVHAIGSRVVNAGFVGTQGVSNKATWVTGILLIEDIGTPNSHFKTIGFI